MLFLHASVIPSLALDCLYEKSVGICICYRPTLRGFSHCPSIVGRQRRNPTLVYAINTSDNISHEILHKMQDNYISKGHLPLLYP